MSNKVLSKELAISELREFLKEHKKRDFNNGILTDAKIEEDYPDVLNALEDGNLVFEDLKPLYKLQDPILNDAGEVSIKDIGFRSRIKGADRIILMNGIDPKKQLGDYMIKVISYMTQQPEAIVKKFEKEDFEVLNQICSVF